jgi:hypothetical protein
MTEQGALPAITTPSIYSLDFFSDGGCKVCNAVSDFRF